MNAHFILTCVNSSTNSHLSSNLQVLTALIGLLTISLPCVAPASCIFGPNGEVLHKSRGSDCRNLVDSAPIDNDAFERPVPIPHGAWIPLTPGTERLYDIVIRRGYSPFDRPLDVQEYQGLQHFRLMTAPERLGKGVMEERVTTRIARDPTQLNKIGLQRNFLRPNANGVDLIASNRYWFGKRRDLTFARGAQLLPRRLRAKVRWDSGTLSNTEIRIEETGQALGLQDIKTPYGDHKGCLVVRYVSRISSPRVDLLGRPEFGGKIIRKVWYARGIGMVRTVERGSLETFDDGDHLVFTADNEMTLRGVFKQALPASMAQK